MSLIVSNNKDFIIIIETVKKKLKSKKNTLSCHSNKIKVMGEGLRNTSLEYKTEKMPSVSYFVLCSSFMLFSPPTNITKFTTDVPALIWPMGYIVPLFELLFLSQTTCLRINIMQDLCNHVTWDVNILLYFKQVPHFPCLLYTSDAADE